MNSCFYTGLVRHRRFSPRGHEFSYRLFYVSLDLDELDSVFHNRWFWSTTRFALARFRRKDYLGDPDVPLKHAVQQKIEAETGKKHNGPVRMLTHLRYFGYVFNPVTFYYCYDKSETRLEYILAEITNTPWGERHTYVLPVDDTTRNNKLMQFSLDKQFHISPFMPMQMQYSWRFSSPDDALYVHMNNYREDKKVFDATLKMQRNAITARSCAYVLAAFPFMTFKVIFGIYWQAFLLYLKRIPFYSHPKNSKDNNSKPAPHRVTQETN